MPRKSIHEKLLVTTRTLLYVAAGVWFFAGGMLIFRGLSGITYKLLDLLLCIAGGMLFYAGMFSGISGKHILRIKNMPGVKHPFYTFFNKRSYIMMLSMISLGVTVRLLNIIPFYYLAQFYVVMGTPLLISSFRFFHSATQFNK